MAQGRDLAPPALWLAVLAAAGYLLHLWDESRFGLPYEPLYVGPTLGILALTLAGFAFHRRLIAVPAGLVAGVLVAYFGGLGHLFWIGIYLMPMTLWDGWGGPLLGVNAVVGVTLAVASASSLIDRLRAHPNAPRMGESLASDPHLLSGREARVKGRPDR